MSGTVDCHLGTDVSYPAQSVPNINYNVNSHTELEGILIQITVSRVLDGLFHVRDIIPLDVELH